MVRPENNIEVNTLIMVVQKVTFRGQTKTCLSLRGLNVADCTGPGKRNDASNSP